MWEAEINTITEWKTIASRVLQNLDTSVLLLKGNLGAGKTTFTQELLLQLGSTDEVSSPTYSIVNEYDTPKGKVYHFDLYRLKNTEEAYDIGIEEYLDNAYLCIIEWPEIYEEEIDLPFHEMLIENTENTRKIKFK
ncbi:tRNA (adenosine(37)-N6)-threonylcarbamoyltransferase complex ATPase subunit type 1 TsaE [Elizabethkingia sp. JS20170427COW]|uniref:tRNA (adenosine(37)-N6)-threonylcarbamoyltransferase complex ATPase subunit type 1 TsaE n=1 Tax=Elizabethkingia sp. JS20170427COW TaxID=2583851 RepID=UPI0011106B49|nr:tRNA (adenosine(37)-N6)-threonylcarbamoyltransferase complex ATPase subunit type 1 TsaE [Elizabethkingia sp. JS20170427COW]QCX53956.1 tRNA (adenosine(37)-N6)-threonylcarbamoyltransferase complex ATPase subunit type 1 TsaE [Elizabethkingia sp. JS20170427COW]